MPTFATLWNNHPTIKGESSLLDKGAYEYRDHIDLWNGYRLTDWRTWVRIHIRIGSFGLNNLGAGADFAKAETVWFWAIL